MLTDGLSQPWPETINRMIETTEEYHKQGTVRAVAALTKGFFEGDRFGQSANVLVWSERVRSWVSAEAEHR